MSVQKIVFDPLRRGILAALLGLACGTAWAVAPGSPAPGFNLKTLDGKPFALADFKGRWVALEWVNPDCPFVQKHYETVILGIVFISLLPMLIEVGRQLLAKPAGNA